MKTAKLLLEVEYDPEVTDPERLAEALDQLLGTASIRDHARLDEHGCPEIGEFFVLEEDPRKT